MAGSGTRGFLLDLNRCTGCDACRLACTIENDLEPDVSWREVHTFNDPRHPGLPVYHLSLACNHCSDAPCMSSCPALAYSRDPVTHAVLLDADRCIGCGYCAWTCPFDAPRYDDRAGVMAKCTFCNPRLLQGEAPACVAACPTRALDCGELDADARVAHVPGFPVTDAAPNVRFVPLRRPDAMPGTAPGSGTGHDACLRVGKSEGRSKIRFASEWPLALFTLIAAGLVGWVAARLLSPLRIDPPAFALVAFVGAGSSTLHLGRKLRAWRAVLNFRGSWLSREVVFFAAFVAASMAGLIVAPGSPAVLVPALALGLACLYSIDRVYDVVRDPGSPKLHSADALLTGLLTAVVIAALPMPVAALGGLKAVLYTARKVRAARAGNNIRPWTGAARLGLGILIPVLAGFVDATAWYPWVLLSFVVGEMIDRYEYYGDLEVPTPRKQVVSDLQALLEDPYGRLPSQVR